jgi:transcriptional regulator with XRE-family HTH domain
MDFANRIKMILETLSLNQTQLAEKLGVSKGVISEFVNGSRPPSKDFIFGISKLGISIDWFITGKGYMLFYENNIPSTEIIVQEEQISGEKIFINKPNNIGNIGSSGGDQKIEIHSVARTSMNPENDQDLKVFKIPLLTKEQVFYFDPYKEISTPKSYSGDYPDHTLVPVPMRFQEYGTDLRAMLVFNSLMIPLLNPGDVVIFQAIGWSGDGIYVYRVDRELHISHVKFDKARYILTKEFKSEENIPYHAESFLAIGRVRAVVREIG